MTTVAEAELLTPKSAAQMVGVDPELLKTWCNEFNIQTERTPGGHRRYTKENIETLISIKEKLHEQNWSYDQVRAWLNGEIEVYTTPEQRSELEKKVDKLLESFDKQERFNMALAKRLDEIVHLYNKLYDENESLKTFITDRDRLIVQALKQSMEEKEKERKRTGFLARIFAK